MSDENKTIRQCGDEKSQCGDAGKFRIDEMFSTPPPQAEMMWKLRHSNPMGALVKMIKQWAGRWLELVGSTTK